MFSTRGIKRKRTIQPWARRLRIPYSRYQQLLFFKVFLSCLGLVLFMCKMVKRKRTVYVKAWRNMANRLECSIYFKVFKLLEQTDPMSFMLYMRLSPSFFKEILARLSPRLERKHRTGFEPLPPGFKFAICLRYLSSGESYNDLSVHWCVSKSSVHNIIVEVCSAIIDEFMDEQLHIPRSKEEWIDEADQFRRRWDLPNCVGAIDGKHVRIRCPARGASRYYNYKKFHSILLLAVVDSNLRFR